MLGKDMDPEDDEKTITVSPPTGGANHKRKTKNPPPVGATSKIFRRQNLRRVQPVRYLTPQGHGPFNYAETGQVSPVRAVLRSAYVIFK